MEHTKNNSHNQKENFGTWEDVPDARLGKMKLSPGVIIKRHAHKGREYEIMRMKYNHERKNWKIYTMNPEGKVKVFLTSWLLNEIPVVELIYPDAVEGGGEEYETYVPTE